MIQDGQQWVSREKLSTRIFTRLGVTEGAEHPSVLIEDVSLKPPVAGAGADVSGNAAAAPYPLEDRATLRLSDGSAGDCWKLPGHTARHRVAGRQIRQPTGGG